MMAGRTKRRGRHRTVTVSSNPIALAIRRASKIPAANLEAVMTPIRDSFRAMREGVATEGQWLILAGSVQLALSIEHQGVVRGLQGHLTAAEAALAEIKHRAMERGTWRPTSLYWQEIEALDTFVLVHKHQMENLSEGEWRRAYDRAEAIVRSSGGQVLDVREVQQEQLQLLEARNG